VLVNERCNHTPLCAKQKEMVMPKNSFRSIPLALAAGLTLACSQGAFAEEFSLEIGSPVAAGNFRAKMAVLAIRSKGCAKPAKVELSGAAEGLVDGARQTVPLAHLTAMPTPGVYAVTHEWPREGAWVVNLTARCDQATAGALVPIGPKGFLRESSQFFARPAAKEEIEAAVQSHAATLSQQPPGAGQ
jgi:hypothetical protein